MIWTLASPHERGFIMKKSAYVFNIRDISEIGILVAAAILLDTFVKIPIFADGGSINIALIPLVFIALHKGWFKGFIAGGVIFGLATCLIDGYGIHTYPLDYLVGFGSVAVIGAFKNKIYGDQNLTVSNYIYFGLSLFVSFVVRVIGSTVSGILFYGLNFYESLVYQLTYMVPSFLAVFLILMPLLNKLKASFDRLSQ